MHCSKCWYKNGKLIQACPLHHLEYNPEDIAWKKENNELLREKTEARNEENEADDLRKLNEFLRGRL